MRIFNPWFCILCALMGLAPSAAMDAETVSVTYFSFYPTSYSENGIPKGSALDVVRKISDGLALNTAADAIPLKRLLQMAKSRPVIVAALARTPDREDDFVWIGKLYCDDLVMATLPPTPRIDSLAEARQLLQIGTAHGGVPETFLLQHDVTNIESSGDMVSEAKKLQASRIDGWFFPRSNIVSGWRAIGGDAAALQVGAPMSSVCIWIAASRSVPDPVVAILRERFSSLPKDRV